MKRQSKVLKVLGIIAITMILFTSFASMVPARPMSSPSEGKLYSQSGVLIGIYQTGDGVYTIHMQVNDGNDVYIHDMVMTDDEVLELSGAIGYAITIYYTKQDGMRLYKGFKWGTLDVVDP